MEAAQIYTCPERDKYVVLVMDEMHIKEHIVNDKDTGNVYFDIKTHGSESRGQEEAACMRVFWPTRPLQ